MTIKLYTIALFLLLTNSLAYASNSDLVIDAGLGVFNSGVSSLAETKLLKTGIQKTLYYPLKQRVNIGAWLDNQGNGRSGSFFTGYQIGYLVDNDTLEAGIFSGPTLISNPDTYLGGVFQFNESIILGIKNNRGECFSLVYNHFSSAGIYQPNLGRDLIGLEVEFKL